MADKSYWENIVLGKDLQKAKRERRRSVVESKQPRESLERLESEGYEYVSEYKDARFVKVRKEKPFFDQFENKVWCVLCEMGFTEMNKDNSFVIPYSPSGATEQIDVFACDGETALVVECKASQKPGKRTDFKTEIEALEGRRRGICDSIKAKYSRDIKIKFIWAVSNIVIGDEDKKRLADFKVEVFDDEAIEYYSGLAQHLGSTSKYQLLGKLFANQETKK